jgi:hypothetical protein
MTRLPAVLGNYQSAGKSPLLKKEPVRHCPAGPILRHDFA